MNCCGNKNQLKKHNAESRLICPVMGNPVNKNEAEEKSLTRKYKRKKYYFCCGGCLEKFDRNPEEYTEKAPNLDNKGSCC